MLNDELPTSLGAQYATRDQWRTNSRKNEEKEPKQKQITKKRQEILGYLNEARSLLWFSRPKVIAI